MSTINEKTDSLSIPSKVMIVSEDVGRVPFATLNEGEDIGKAPPNWLRLDPRLFPRPKRLANLNDNDSSSVVIGYWKDKDASLFPAIVNSKAEPHDLNEYVNFGIIPQPELSSSQLIEASSALNNQSELHDIIAPASTLQKIFKLPFSNTHFSLMVHRVGSSLVIDGFADVDGEYHESPIPVRVGSQENTMENIQDNTTIRIQKPQSLPESPIKKIQKIPSANKINVGNEFDNSTNVPSSSKDINEYSLGLNIIGNKKSLAESPSKKIQKIPSVSKVNVGDEFDNSTNVPSSSSSKGLNEYSLELNTKKKKSTRKTLEKQLISKFLYKTVLGADNMKVNALNNSDDTQPSQDLLSGNNLSLPPAPIGFSSIYQWNFDDLKVLLGSNLRIFSSPEHPAITLKLNDVKEAYSPFTALQYWLENLMANVPELAVCYHENGRVVEYQLLKTSEIPFYLKGASKREPHFYPEKVLKNALKVLHFLQESCIRNGASYWVYKSADDEVLKVVELDIAHKKKMNNESSKNDNEKKYSFAVGMLFARMANQLLAKDKMDLNDREQVKALLSECLTLLDKDEHPIIYHHIGVKLGYMQVENCLFVDSNMEDTKLSNSLQKILREAKERENSKESKEDISSMSKGAKRRAKQRMQKLFLEVIGSSSKAANSQINSYEALLILNGLRKQHLISIEFFDEAISALREYLSFEEIENIRNKLNLVIFSLSILEFSANRMGYSLYYLENIQNPLIPKFQSRINGLKGLIYYIFSKSNQVVTEAIKDYKQANESNIFVNTTEIIKLDTTSFLMPETNLKNALNHLLLAVQILKSSNDNDSLLKRLLRHLGNTQNELGNLYLDQNRITKAMDMFSSALESFFRADDLINEALVLMNQGRLFRMMAFLEEKTNKHSDEKSGYFFATEKYEKARELLVKLGDDIKNSSIWKSLLEDMGMAYLQLGEFLRSSPSKVSKDSLEAEKQVTNIYTKAFKLFKSIENRARVAGTHYYLGMYYKDLLEGTRNSKNDKTFKSRLISAIVNFRKAEEFFVSPGYSMDLFRTRLALSKLYSMNEQYRVSFEKLLELNEVIDIVGDSDTSFLTQPLLTQSRSSRTGNNVHSSDKTFSPYYIECMDLLKSDLVSMHRQQQSNQTKQMLEMVLRTKDFSEFPSLVKKIREIIKL